MILNNPITINPPPQTDNTGKVVNPPQIQLSVLDVTYHDNPINNILSATIRNIPGHIVLLQGDTYILAGDYTQSFIENKLRSELGEDPAKKLRSMFPKTLEEDPDGPGTILTGMISSIGIKSTSNCSCRKHAIEMNTLGNDWCEENIGTVLGWLKEESTKRNLPFVEMVAKLMVQRAIKTSRRALKKKEEGNA
jgi:hypothetical protein